MTCHWRALKARLSPPCLSARPPAGLCTSRLLTVGVMARRHGSASWLGVMARRHGSASWLGVMARRHGSASWLGVMARRHGSASWLGVMARPPVLGRLGVMALAWCLSGRPPLGLTARLPRHSALSPYQSPAPCSAPAPRAPPYIQQDGARPGDTARHDRRHTHGTRYIVNKRPFDKPRPSRIVPREDHYGQPHQDDGSPSGTRHGPSRRLTKKYGRRTL